MLHPPSGAAAALASYSAAKVLAALGVRSSPVSHIQLGKGCEMDCNWREWRRMEDLWERFEEKDWELGPVRYVNLPPVLAESGPYRIAFLYTDHETGEALFELREMRGQEERGCVLVWGLPTPQGARSLLKGCDAYPEELPEISVAEAAAQDRGLWGGLMPPVVCAEESHRELS